MVTRDNGSAPVAATLLGLTRASASAPTELCVSVQRVEASVPRGHSAQWNVSVWATGGKVGRVMLGLTTSPSSQKPRFTSGCSTEGKNSCSMGTIGSRHKQLRAQVPIAATATFKSVKLTVKGSGTHIKTDPTAAVPIGVTAPAASGSASAGAGGAGRAKPGTGVLTPAGVRSTLGAGGFPFVNAAGARAGLQPTLSPGGNASSLFPTLNPSSGPNGPNGTSRIRSLADSLPGDASLMGAQYAGLAALALAFILSVTRFQLRRRQAAAQSPASPTP